MNYIKIEEEYIPLKGISVDELLETIDAKLKPLGVGFAKVSFGGSEFLQVGRNNKVRKITRGRKRKELIDLQEVMTKNDKIVRGKWVSLDSVK